MSDLQQVLINVSCSMATSQGVTGGRPKKSVLRDAVHLCLSP